MKKDSRDIDPRDAVDLLERVPRACLSFTNNAGSQVQPVGVHLRDSRYLVCLPEKAESLPGEGQEAVLLIDEGIYYFELRAIYIRGQLEHVEPPGELHTGRMWFELKPCKTVAWDYGTLHEVSDEP